MASKFQNISIGNFKTSWSFFFFFFFLFFPKCKKSNISVIHKAIILIFLVNLPMANIYKLCKNKFDPTTWRISRTTSRWRSTQKVWAIQNFIKKNKMTGRVDILRRIWSKNIQKIYFFGSFYTSIFTFFCSFLKMHQSISNLSVILSFMNFFVAQTSGTRFFLQLL